LPRHRCFKSISERGVGFERSPYYWVGITLFRCGALSKTLCNLRIILHIKFHHSVPVSFEITRGFVCCRLIGL
jgi:hypothetical protein